LIVAHPRPTRLDPYAAHVLRFEHGRSVETVLGLASGAAKVKGLERYAGRPEVAAAAGAVAQAGELVVFFGSEGMDLPGTRRLAEACASLLKVTGHAGKANSGIIGVWPAPMNRAPGTQPAHLRMRLPFFTKRKQPTWLAPASVTIHQRPALDALVPGRQDLYLPATASALTSSFRPRASWA
jgi:hypothetical protein